MDLRPKCKTRYKKLLEGNVDRTLFNINHSNIFLDLSPRTLEIKKKDKQMVTFSYYYIIGTEKVINPQH